MGRSLPFFLGIYKQASIQPPCYDKFISQQLPEFGRDYQSALCGIEKEIVLAGVVSHIEIWSKERWQAESSYDDMDEVAEHMASLGLII